MIKKYVFINFFILFLLFISKLLYNNIIKFMTQNSGRKFYEYKRAQLFHRSCKRRKFYKSIKNLFVCQSALSKAIKSFENDLDIKLIDRTSKNFELTPEGQLLFENGVIALKVINEQLDMLLDSVSLEKGKIKLGVPPVISTIYFTSLIQSFKENYPSINLQITEAGANTVKNKVNDGDIDIGVVILPF